MAKKHRSRSTALPKRLNEPFHPNMLRIGAGGQRLVRGHIRHSPDNKPCFGRVGFLYNPSEISVSHSIDPTQVSDAVTGGQSAAIGEHNGPGVGIGNVSIPLLFDRTYELWDRKPGTLASQYGVYHDVSSFYAMVGLTAPSSTPFAAMITGVNTTWASTYPIQPAQPTMVYAQIGVTANDSTGIQSGLKYYGQITGLDVTYTHWSHDMIPMRCAVNVSILLLTDPNAGSTALTKKKQTPFQALTNGGLGQ